MLKFPGCVFITSHGQPALTKFGSCLLLFYDWQQPYNNIINRDALTTFEGNSSPGPLVLWYVASEKTSRPWVLKTPLLPSQYWKKKETDNPRSKVVRQKRQPYSTSSSISFSDFNKSKFLDDEFFEQQRTLGTLNYILVKQHRCLPCH